MNGEANLRSESICHDAQIQLQNYSQDSVTCLICYGQFEEHQIHLFGNCQHTFCRGCLLNHIQASVGSANIPKCPDYECPEQMDLKGQLYLSLPAVTKTKIQKVISYRQNITDPNFQPCQVADCDGALSLVSYCCKDCGEKHCKKCTGLAHEGECPVKIAVQLEMNQKYRQCGRCGQMIQKSQGCTHMTCTCGNYFCYSCGQPLKGGEHYCTSPESLKYLQKVRWEVEHLEFWYQGSNFTLLRVLLLFSPSSNTTTLLKWLWVVFFTIVIYPWLVLAAFVLVLTALGLIIGLTFFLSLLVPFIALFPTNGLELCPNEQLQEQLGCCVTLILVILFYPIFYVIDLVQFSYEIIQEEGQHILRPFLELGHGLKLVLLFPCLMGVNNEQYYMQTAKMRETDPSLPYHLPDFY